MEDQFREEAALGWMVELTDAEAVAEYGGNLHVAALAAIAEGQAPRDPRRDEQGERQQQDTPARPSAEPRSGGSAGGLKRGASEGNICLLSWVISARRIAA